MSSSNLIDTKSEERRMCESAKCPSCGHKLNRKPDWVGLPAGVKFDPTDQELMEHLEAKVKAEASKSHPLIDEFIPTIEGEDGICYTHPEKLPGVKKDGLSKHYFHRPSKAYTTGTRKRRKIQTESDTQGGETRWHKTGKTRPVIINGKQKGCKKILVLYTNFGKHRKPEKTNWVMHQYHLGVLEEEKEGELVVSKIFYQTQPRQSSWTDRGTGTVAVVAGTEVMDQRRDSGSLSCSSSKEAVNQGDDLSSGPRSLCGYSSAMELHHHQQLKASASFGFSPFSKCFDEAISTREEHAHHDHHHPRITPLQAHHATTQERQQLNVMTTVAFHNVSPGNPNSAIAAPQLHQATVILDDAFHVPNPRFQHQHQQKLERGSTSGLEELIMGCTSSIKGETLMSHYRGTEWKYPYWLPSTKDHDG